MKLSSLKILGQTYSLVFKPSSDMEDALGLCISDKNIIQLREKMTPEKEAEVIIHESIHAISNMMEIGLKEKQVSALAVGVLALIKDNDCLLQQLTKPQQGTPLEAQKPSRKESSPSASGLKAGRKASRVRGK